MRDKTRADVYDNTGKVLTDWLAIGAKYVLNGDIIRVYCLLRTKQYDTCHVLLEHLPREAYVSEIAV